MVDLLRAASDRFRGEAPINVKQMRADTVPRLPREALEALIAALAGPKAKPYRVASRSRSRARTFYTIDQAGSDFLCSCPGFKYRGTCSHARDSSRARRSPDRR